MTNHSSSAGQFRLLNQHLQKNGAAKHCIMYYKSDISSLWSIMAVPNLQCWHFNRKQVFPHPIIHLLSTGITLLVSWEFQDGLLQDRCLHFNGLFRDFYWRPQKSKQQPNILLLYQQHTGKVHALVNGWYKAFKLIQHVSIICQWISATTVYTTDNFWRYLLPLFKTFQHQHHFAQQWIRSRKSSRMHGGPPHVKQLTRGETCTYRRSTHYLLNNSNTGQM